MFPSLAPFLSYGCELDMISSSSSLSNPLIRKLMVVEHNIVLSSWILLTLTLCVCLAWQPIDQEVDSCVWLNQLQHNFVLRSWDSLP